MEIYRVVKAYFSKKAVPAVALRPGHYPKEPGYANPANAQHRNYWKFVGDHEVELSSEENAALTRYRDNSAGINHYLRRDPKEPIQSTEEDIEHLDNAIAKSWMKRPVTLWRSISPAKGEPITDKLLSLGVYKEGNWNTILTVSPVDKRKLDRLVGFKFREPAFSSASLAPGNFQRTRGIQLRIMLDKGQVGLLVNSAYEFTKSKDISDGLGHLFAREHEVLLPRSTLFQVESASYTETKEEYQTVKHINVTVRVIDF